MNKEELEKICDLIAKIDPENRVFEDTKKYINEYEDKYFKGKDESENGGN